MIVGPGTHVMLTGARGGLGTPMTLALARTGAKLTLVAYPGLDLDEVRVQAEQLGAKAVAIKFDLAHRERLPELLAEAKAHFGPVDVLINNAGVEFTAAY